MGATLCGDEVRWTVEGAVTSVVGAGFPSPVAVGEAVEVEMSYTSEVQTRGLSLTTFPAGSRNGTGRFYGDINLTITVRMGSEVWSAVLPTVPDSLNAFYSDCWDSVANPAAMLTEFIEAELTEADGADFTRFSFSGPQANRSLSLEFRDSVYPTDFLSIQIPPNSLTKVSAMTAGTGQVAAGGSRFTFSLDPATLAIREPQVDVALVRGEADLNLTWATESGSFYRVDSSENLRDWTFFRGVSGTGQEATRTVTPSGEEPKRFFRVVVFGPEE